MLTAAWHAHCLLLLLGGTDLLFSDALLGSIPAQAGSKTFSSTRI